MKKLILMSVVALAGLVVASCGQGKPAEEVEPVDSTAVVVDSVAVDSTVVAPVADTTKAVK